MEKFVLDKKGLFISSVGNAFVWYDFALFMPFLFIFSKIFFPIEDVTTHSLVSFLAMSSALVVRPLGSAIFGPISDKIGRRKAVEISIFLMAASTFCIGLLPNYDQIGIWAPILLVFFRILQGISMGGGYGAAIVHLVEIAPSKHRGFFGSFAEGGSQIGVWLSGATLLCLYKFFSEAQIYEFAWRIPFFCSAVLIPFAFISNDEEPEETNSKKHGKTSIFKMLLTCKKEMLCTMGITSFSSIGFYALFTFLPYYFTREGILDLKQSTECTSIAAIFVAISTFGAGYLSDYFSRKLFLKIGMYGVCIATFMIFLRNDRAFDFIMFAPILYVARDMKWKQAAFVFITGFGAAFFMRKFSNNDFYLPVTYALYGFFLGLYFGSRPAFFAETFRKEVRCTGVSISLAFAHAIIGCLSNLILDFCTKISNICATFPIIIGTVIALYAMSKLEDRTGKELV